ncbi:MAG: DUF6263 family protein [Ginsengibacter sp.]
MKKTFSLLFFASVIWASAFSQGQINLTKGQKYQVDSKVVTASSTEVQGQTMETNVDAASIYNIEVKDVTNDSYVLNNTLKSLKSSTSQMGQEMNFDSDKKDDMAGPIGTALAGTINVPMSVVFSKNGTVIPDKAAKKSEDKSMIARSVATFEATGYGSQLAFIAIPASSKVGDTWTSTNDTKDTKTTTNYTIKEINGDVVTLSISGTTSNDVTMENNGMELEIKTSGKFTGEEKVNSKTGVIQSSNTVTDASGTVGAMGQEFPSTTKVITTTTVKML